MWRPSNAEWGRSIYCVWLCVCVRETRGKAIQGDYKNRLQPELWVCFHGEVESAFKKWLYPVIKERGHIGQHSSDDVDVGPFIPCGSGVRGEGGSYLLEG